MKLIDKVTVGSAGATSITFSAIPGTYTDLVLLYSGRGNNGISQPTINLNSSASSFTDRVLYTSSGGTVGTYAGTTDLLRTNNSGQTANVFSNGQIYIGNYTSNTTKYLQWDVATEDNSTYTYMGIGATQWAQTAAITSITLNLSSWVEHSTAYLYGITKGSGGATAS